MNFDDLPELAVERIISVWILKLIVKYL